MSEQKGYIFHSGKCWYVRFYDDVLQPDGKVKRVQVCKKLSVEYGGEYRTKRSVQPFAQELLAPFNRGVLNPQSTMLVSEFVGRVYLPEYVEKNLRAATKKQYKDVWQNHLKPRMGKLTLRGFRTVHGEQMLTQIAAQAKLGRSSLRHCKALLSGTFKQAKRLGFWTVSTRSWTFRSRACRNRKRIPTHTVSLKLKPCLRRSVSLLGRLYSAPP